MRLSFRFHQLASSGMTNENTSIPLHDRIRLIRIQAFFRSASGNPFSLVLGGGLSALALASVGVPAYPLGVWFALILVSCGLIFTSSASSSGVA